MNIGDVVFYQGRPYYLRGFDPTSLPERQAFLEDVFTGEERAARFAELESDGSDGRQRPTRV